MPAFDLDRLDPSSRTFSRDLASSASEVSSAQAQAYLGRLVPLLSDAAVDDPMAVARAIAAFVARDGAHAGPLLSAALAAQVPADGAGLEVIRAVALAAPAALGAYAGALGRASALYADHVLFIVALYSRDPAGDALAVFGLLFAHGAAFRARATAEDYLSLLCHLLGREAFRAAHAGDAWGAACAALAVKSEPVVSLAYAALATAAHHGAGVGALPAAQIAAHLRRPRLQGAVVALLIRLPRAPPGADLAGALLAAAAANRRASIALMRLCADADFAALVAADLAWLARPLVRWDYNVRLFGVLMWHVGLRPRLLRAPDLPAFFAHILELEDAVTIAATLARRLPWDGAAVARLAADGVWRAFFARAFASDDESDVRSAMTVAITLAGVCYCADLADVARRVVRLLADEAHERIALATALRLTKRAECVPAFEKAGLADALAPLAGKRDYREAIREINDALRSDERG
jgi:hypothetical protein